MQKCRSRHFQSERGSKKFEDLGRGGSGLNIFRTGMGYDLGGVTFAGGGGRVSTPLHKHIVNTRYYIMS